MMVKMQDMVAVCTTSLDDRKTQDVLGKRQKDLSGLKVKELLNQRKRDLAETISRFESVKHQMTEHEEERTLLEQALRGMGIRINDCTLDLGNADMLWRYDWLTDLISRLFRATEIMADLQSELVKHSCRAKGLKAEIAELK